MHTFLSKITSVYRTDTYALASFQDALFMYDLDPNSFLLSVI